MALAILDSNGKITIPESIRERLSLRAGVQVELILQKDGSVLLCPIHLDVSSLCGVLARPEQEAFSLNELKLAIRKAGARNR